MFQNYLSDEYNEMGPNKDFNLYSTYKDAVQKTNPWTYCNFNTNKRGFPRDCADNGPNRNYEATWSKDEDKRPQRTVEDA